MQTEEVIRVAESVRAELSKVVIGQSAVIDQVVVALLAGGHVLLEGPPGTAKTLLVRGLALAVDGDFARIQFTPDLMPSDITGVNVYESRESGFRFHPGPLFCDILLADEINRAPAKTQSALLEAMQEARITIDGVEHPLGKVFTTIATQNPIEYEGTYPLPEAQLDRFMVKAIIDYPEREHEDEMLLRHQEGFDPRTESTFGVNAVVNVEQLEQVRQAVRSIRVQPEVLRYITSIIRATRDHHALLLGASPRASVMLLGGSRAQAVLRGRDFVTPDDVKDLAVPILRHRVVMNPEAEIEGVTADRIIGEVLQRVEVPRI